MSRIGKKPIVLPDGVSFSLNGDNASVKNSKGELFLTIPEAVSIEEKDNQLYVSFIGERTNNKAIYGTIRSLLSNMVEGLTKGFVKELEIQGVGFRASVKGGNLDLNLGKSHPIFHPIPEGLKVEVKNDTHIIIEGIDKQKVGQFAAEIRSYYPPEPYKGKGVRYLGEYVRRKAGKSV